ncbi:MAG: ATP-binding cassette domain-containing protein, partial [Deltaproteobacteria bacterium]
MAEIKFNKIEKSYGSTKVVHGIDLDIKDKEFVVLVGPSGCGKSTTLRMVAGLEDITGGELVIGEQVVNKVCPSDRGVAMVFQDYALYPHMSVYENMAFGLRLKNLSENEIDARVQEAARMLDLGPYLQRKPAALSGGQRQRVAMGRAVVKKAKV